MDKKINTAIIGFGLSGKVFHAPFIHEHQGFKLSKVVERHNNHAQSIYKNIETIRDFNDLLIDDSLDLIVIATSNIYHYPMAMACLKAGKHIVIEKPFMPSSAEAEEIIQISEQKSLKVFVYQNRRWDGDFLSIKKLIAENKLGEIQYFESHFDRYSPERKRAAWRDERLAGSGNLFDLGSHLIDQAYALFGKPISVSADLQAQREGSQVDDFFEVKMSYPHHQVNISAGMLVKNHELRYLIKGTKGIFIKNGIDPQEAKLKEGKQPKGENWGKENPESWGIIEFTESGIIESIETEAGNYMAFYQNVYDVLINNADMDIPLSDTKDVIKIIEMAFESNQKKSTILFK